MMVRSLEGRLHLGVGVTLTLLLAGLWILAHEALHRVADEFVYSRLQHDADALVAAFHLSRSGQPRLGQRRLTPVYHQPYSGHYFALLTTNGERIQSRSLWDQDMEVKPLKPGEQAQWLADGPNGQKLLVWGGGFHRQGHDFSLAVAENISPLRDAMRGMEWLIAGFAIGGWLLLTLILRRVVHGAFRQLQPVYEDIERLERGESVALTEDVPPEVLPLVHKLNRLLVLYHQRLERSRKAAGNLAHALKTPLNLMMQRLEHARLEPSVQQALRNQVEKVHALTERELKRARFAGPARPGQRFYPAEELPTLAQLIEQMQTDKDLDIQCRVEIPQSIAADREDMLEILGNLLENASKWAKKRIECRIWSSGGRVHLTVEDDGPGCDEKELQRIADRGVRLDERRDGHGLGLSITKDIVDLYGGSIRFGRSETLGGFSVLLELPV